MKHLLITTVFLMSIWMEGQAQTILRLIDRSNGTPIEQGVVYIQAPNQKGRHVFISDTNGEVHLPTTAILYIEISHINFKPKKDTVHQTSVKTVYLTPEPTTLSEVVVVGQHQPQSIKNAVFNVRAINSDRIEKLAATDVPTLLSQQLNIRMSRDNATGTSGISFQGLSGQYVKVLINGIPMEGRSGVANAIDLGQLDVNLIEKIEIVEGPMSVEYGSDALAGVINIVTKKNKKPFEATLVTQTETVGDEFDFFDKGIHSVGLLLGIAPSDKISANLSAKRYLFMGWQGESEGRTQDWYPKQQSIFNTGLQFTPTNALSIDYQLDWLHETLSNHGPVVDKNPLKDPVAIDETYTTRRQQHRLQTIINTKQIEHNTSISFSDYTRNTNQYILNLVNNDKTNTASENQEYVQLKSWFLRHYLTKNMAFGSLVIGAEGQIDHSSATTLSKGEKTMESYALYSSLEIKLNKFKFRPGIRMEKNSQFSTVPTATLNAQYKFNEKIQLRMGYGRGYRTPSIRELYHEFIDSNHNILGNPNLEPEYSNNFNTRLDYSFEKSSTHVLLAAYYNHLKNKITYFTPTAVNSPTSYINLLEYTTWGGRIEATHPIKSFKIVGGVGLLALEQKLNEFSQVPDFTFSPEINLQPSFTFQNAHLTLLLNCKYTGAVSRYQIVEEQPELGKIEGYFMGDFTLNKKIKNAITLSAGIKNLLNVSTINSSSPNGPHGGSAFSVGYGRSYFFYFKYNFSQP